MAETATQSAHPGQTAASTANSLRRETFLIRLFGLVKIPLIGYVRPRVVRMDDEAAIIRIPLGRRTKNHLGSMYFGALAIGADIAAGIAAMRLIQQVAKRGDKVSFVFKDIQGRFLRRPDGHVDFACQDVAAVRALVEQAIKSGEREEMPVPVVCTVKGHPDPVAEFTLTISLKRRDA